MQFRSSFQANMIRHKVCALELSVRPMTGMPAILSTALTTGSRYQGRGYVGAGKPLPQGSDLPALAVP
eukprot:scaffold101_cov373-Prasinococcus_capsulatus_cf.AAC.4